MKAIGYTRVSTEGQAADGVSLAAQEAKIRAWAEFSDAELSAVYCDAGVSGFRADKRPEFLAAVDRACREKCALVVYSLSRFARNTREGLELIERLTRAGADLVSLSERIDTTSAAGKMMVTMLLGFAQMERDLASERTTCALAHKKSRGERVGTVPYGYHLAADGTHLEPDADEQAVIAEARALRESGLSLRRIGERLAGKGLLPRTGGQWHAETVKALLKAEVAA
jgi:DNA invertase Pin-like site-specific DNA recombinase